MNDIAIKVDNLSKVYKLYDKPMDRLKEAVNPLKKIYHKDFYALNNVAFEVKKGETVGIIGKNGSGKSTLLKIITGVLNKSGGNVIVNGKISALLELGAGFNPEFTGLENIYLNCTIMGYTKEEIDEKIPGIIEFADIGEFINQAVKTYSSGMFIRLAFAVAVNVEPEILIVDEALSVGDLFFQTKCYKRFDDLKENGKTIIFVSHDMGSIIKYCDRSIVLNNGEKVFDGYPNEAVDIYKQILVNLFGSEEKTCSIITNMDSSINTLSEIEKWAENVSKNPHILEYGDGGATIIDYTIFDNQGRITSQLIKGDNCSFCMRVKFNKTIENPIFAFTIKDKRGVEITGTNTLNEKVDTCIIQEGKVAEIKFKQKITLQGGEYLLSLGCTGFNEKGELVVYHRLYDIISFDVISSGNTAGYFDPYSTVNFKIYN